MFRLWNFSYLQVTGALESSTEIETGPTTHL